MVRIVFGYIIVSLLFSFPTFAASFDCTKAQTSVEHAICDNPFLSTADEEMASAYRTAHQGLSETGFKIVRQGQRDWLKYIQKICTKDAQPLTGRYDDEGMTCLDGQILERTSMLAQITGSQGYRYYSADAFFVAPDTNYGPQGAFAVGSFQFSALQIDGTDDLAIRFNQHVRDSYPVPFGSDSFSGETDSVHSVTLINDTARLISTEVSDWAFYHGAAHGQFSIYYDHFLTVEKRPLAATDIFADPDWLPKLDAIVVAVLKASEYSNSIWEDLTSVADMLSDVRSWNFGQGELIIQFQAYAVGPYALGAPTVRIPWTMIGGLITHGALDIVEGI